jgi:NADPH:quinone reductase-like Zn-dependent oxidoreductase
MESWRPQESRRNRPAGSAQDNEHDINRKDTTVPRAVRYNEYGGIEVLRVDEVGRPVPAPGQFVLKVKATGINPGEGVIREGALHDWWPATFPSGQGYDLAGIVDEIGANAGPWVEGDEVSAFTFSRSAQADYVLVEADHAIRRPANVSWEVAGSIYTVGATAYAGVRAAALTAADVVVVSGAAGGVGSLVSQLAKRSSATVIGLASPPNHEWLAGHGVIPVEYGEGVADRIRAAAPSPVTKFIDCFGNIYVELALNELGLARDRIVTLVDPTAGRTYGVKYDGWSSAKGTDVLSELVGLLAEGSLELPIANTYPLAEVQDAYREVEKRHSRGKIVLIP